MMGPPLVLLGSGLEQWGRQLLLLGRSFATAASLAFKTVMGPPMVLLVAGVQAVAQFMLPIWQVCPMPCLLLMMKSCFAVAPGCLALAQLARGSLCLLLFAVIQLWNCCSCCWRLTLQAILQPMHEKDTCLGRQQCCRPTHFA